MLNFESLIPIYFLYDPKFRNKMFLKWILFIIISFIVIYNIHVWIDKVISSRRKTRDLVTSQTSKYKEMLEQLLNQENRIQENSSSNSEEEDLLAFSRSLESEIL